MVLNRKLGSVLSREFRRPDIDRARELAYEVFSAVIRRGEYSNLLLPRRLTESALDSRDKSFITELVYGSIRQIGRNDHIAGKFSVKPWTEVDEGIVDIVRIGAYQLFDMRVPTHAAVDSTVNLARRCLGESKGSYVNAIMRKLASMTLEEHLSEVSDDSIASLAIRYSHPEWIVNSYRDLISDKNELKSLLEANNRPVPPTLVAWPGRSTRDDLVNLGAVPTNYSEYGATYSGAPSELEPIRERRAGVQDEGSQILAVIFSEVAREKEPWLDLCAGPGGKAALLSSLAKGDFYANEISDIRADLIRRVVKPGTHISIGDGREINLKVGSIIADVPCTGLGALRRRPEVRWRRSISDLAKLTSMQYQLAEHAIEILPSGGIFAYATCSPHIAETSAQCAAFERKLQVERIDVTPFMPKNLENGTRNGFMQLWPHRHNTDAMFLALYKKR